MLRLSRRRLNVVGEIKQTLLNKRTALVAQTKTLKEKHADQMLSKDGDTISKAYGGMRDIVGLVYEPSLLDAHEGIRFRGLTIPECQEKLPRAADGESMLPEAMFWLLLTGDVPTSAQAAALNEELIKRSQHGAVEVAVNTVAALPQSAHPMTQFSAGILGLQTGSQFAAAYAAGKANKDNYWEYAVEDTLDCVARSPLVAAAIYNRLKTGKVVIPENKPGLDWAANFTQQMGFQDKEFWDAMRLYLSIHVDHEGGNVSAHTTSLVASALSDPYLALSAGMNGLAGPLHGLANQEVLLYIHEMQQKCKAAGVNMKDDKALEDSLTKFTWDLLNSKRVVPGYGHAVLRKTDPRYTCQREFCLKHCPDYELFRLVSTIYKIMPDILTKHGKTKNPFPNVDAHSGCLLQYYGLMEQEYYTVLFGVSRQMGVLSGVVWDRLMGRPIERPKSITTEALYKKYVQ